MAVNGRAVAAVAAGGILFVSGLRGWSISATFRDILAGKAPGANNVNPITGTSAADIAANSADAGLSGVSSAAGLATNSDVANDALKYRGAGYVWGGNPSAGIGHWDCSSFVSWVLGHDLGMAIPGYKPGQYTGSVHGPVTGQYLVWSGAISIPRASMQAGDLACFLTHIGIVTGSEQMISALNPSLGTQVTSIKGGSPAGETVHIRRLVTSTAAGRG